jgi:hypothetical protein
MDTLKPAEIGQNMIDAGIAKSSLAAEKLLIRGILSGAPTPADGD